MSRLLRSATAWHVASLVLGGIAIVWIGTTQWFHLDDFAILTPSVDWGANHQGHWTLSPLLLFRALRAVIGYHAYLPYLVFAILAHLVAVHLLWRVLRRLRLAPWLSTLLAAALLVSATAPETYLWAFQVGYIGGIAFGLGVLLLVDRPVLGWPGRIGVVLLSVVGVTFSGTVLPLLAAAGVLSWVRRGFWRSALLLLPVAVVYGSWFLLHGADVPRWLAPRGIEWVTNAPLFFAAMLTAGAGMLLGTIFAGPVVVAGLAVQLWTGRRELLRAGLPATVLLGAGIVFALLTASSRSGNGLEGVGSLRYGYLLTVCLLPMAGLGLQRLRDRGRSGRVVVGALVAAILAGQVIGLGIGAVRSAEVEASLQRRVAAAVDVVAAHPELDDGLQPVRSGLPDLRVRGIREGIERGMWPEHEYGAEDLAAVERALGLPESAGERP